MISTVDSITIDWDQRPVSCTMLLPQRGEVLAMTNDQRLLKINTRCACVDRVAEVLWIP
jgi:hypothetical protein